MIQYLKLLICSFFDIEQVDPSVPSMHEEILSKITDLEEINKQILEDKIESDKKQDLDNRNLKVLLYIIIALILLSGGIFFYTYYLLNADITEYLKSLGILSKDLHSIDVNVLVETFKKLNQDSVNLNKEEIRLLFEIKNILMKKGLLENTSLNRPLPEIVRPTKTGGIDWNEFW